MSMRTPVACHAVSREYQRKPAHDACVLDSWKTDGQTRPVGTVQGQTRFDVTDNPSFEPGLPKCRKVMFAFGIEADWQVSGNPGQ